MGIYDRDYYRESTSTSWNASQTPMVKIIVVASVVVFVFQMLMTGQGDPLVEAFGLYKPWANNNWQVWRLLSAAFLHAGVMHIAINMLVLWWFGHEIETLYGRAEFAVFYVVAAVCASITFLAIPSGAGVMMGASGAVMAVMALFVIHYPRHKIMFYFLFPIEARWLLLIYMIYDILPLVRQDVDAVAHAAHLGGFAFAFIYKWSGVRLTSILPSAQSARSLKRRVTGTKLRVFDPDSQPDTEFDELQKRVDEILAKISREGRDSLTADEVTTLEKASEVLRNRRAR